MSRTPEQFGAVGDGITDDTLAVQACINAGPGLIELNGRYRISKSGSIDRLGLIRYVDYALWVNQSGVWLRGPGAFVIDAPVALTNPNGLYIAVLFGNGGSSNGIRPGDTGTWVSDVRLEDMTFENGSGASVGLYCTFAYCQDFAATGNHIPNAAMLTGDGALCTSMSSRRGVFRDNTVFASTRAGIWVDGARAIRIEVNHIEASGRQGVQVSANLDNGIAASRNVIRGNVILDYAKSGTGPGISFGGCSDSIVADNLIQTSTGAIGIQLGVYATSGGKAEASRNIVTGNSIIRDVPSGTTIGIELSGADVNAFDGTNLAATDNIIANNHIAGFLYGIRANQQARAKLASNQIRATYMAYTTAATGRLD